MQTQQKKIGFTIVELLIVIVVIGILAAITIVAYNGVQDKARSAKIKSDLRNIENAIILARTPSSQVLGLVTGDWSTGWVCTDKPAGTNLATLPRTDGCWVDYLDTLDKISVASGQNIRGLVDPWGRPYLIDENENEADSGDCRPDDLGVYRIPLSGWTTMANTHIAIRPIAPACV